MSLIEILTAIGGAIVTLLTGAFGRDLIRAIGRSYRERKKAEAIEVIAEAKRKAAETETTGKFLLAEQDAHRSGDRFLRDLVHTYGERVDTLMARIDALNLRIDSLQEEVAECERLRAIDVARADRLEAEVIQLRNERRTL